MSATRKPETGVGVLNDLMPWQRQEVVKIAEGRHRALWADPGVGKTAVAARAALQRRRQGCPLPTLYLAPSALVGQVGREFVRWWPGCRVCVIRASGQAIDPRADAVVIGYGLLSRQTGLIDRLRPLAFGLMVMDESHYLRSHEAKRTQIILLAANAIATRAQQRLFLSGTMLVNHAGDLHPMITRLGVTALASTDPKGVRRSISRSAYESKFVVFAEKFFGGRSIRMAVGSKNLPELHTALAPHLRRARLQDVIAGLPSLRLPVLPLEADIRAVPGLPPGIAGAVQNLMDDIAELEEGPVRAAAQTELMALLDEANIALSTWRRALGEAKAPAAAGVLIDRLQSGEPQAVCFVHHRSVGDAIKDALAEAGIACGLLRGGISQAERDATIAAFKGGALRVVICQHESGGTGVDGLQVARYGLVVESPWTAAALRQSVARLWRAGQRNAVLVEIATAAGTLDETIAEIIARKAGEAAALSTGEQP